MIGQLEFRCSALPEKATKVLSPFPWDFGTAPFYLGIPQKTPTQQYKLKVFTSFKHIKLDSIILGIIESIYTPAE